VEIRLLDPDDAHLLSRVATDVFDEEPDPRLIAEFLTDPRHHLVVAIERDLVVGFASAVHYVHPDKPAELWINEVGVAPTFRRRGVGREILRVLLAHAERLGCREAWVLTTRSNDAAIRLYQSLDGSEAADDPPVMFTFQLGVDGAGRGSPRGPAPRSLR
jgi:ribosomal protein S18 acetylase RimI-like enzyme